MGGTIRVNRIGLETKAAPIFSQLKKKFTKTFNPTKPENGGYVRGHWEAFCDPNSDIVVSVVKDSIIEKWPN